MHGTTKRGPPRRSTPGTASPRQGGVATDDYTTRPWTLPEILSGAMIDGLRFFDFRGYHELNREH